jgi:hypothetical protein
MHISIYVYMIKFLSVLYRMRNVSDKNCRENLHTLFMFNKSLSKNNVIYEKIHKNTLQPERPKKTKQYGDVRDVLDN